MWNHTPGPWHRDGTINGRPWTVHCRQKYEDHGPSLGKVATCEDVDGDMDTQIANAMLIAAAPELLAAIEALVDVSWTHLTGGYQDLIEDAQDAIRKAKGE